jgi:MraZ protein
VPVKGEKKQEDAKPLSPESSPLKREVTPLSATVESKPDEKPAPWPTCPVGEEKKAGTVVTLPAAQPTAGSKPEEMTPANVKAQDATGYALPNSTLPTPTVAPPKTDNTPYHAADGETLRSIAKKVLGTEERWREIEKLNPELRARTIVPAGTLVRLPGCDTPAPVGGQAEAEDITPATRSGIKPLPVVRARPEAGKGGLPMTGSYECKIDATHGLVLPKAVCEQVGKCEMMFLTPGPDRCLWLVSQSGAGHVLHRVEKSQVGDAEVQAFRRLYFSQTEKAAVDADARLRVPEKLADYAGLTGQVVLIGMDDHFEVWDAARWHRYSLEKGTTPTTPRSSDE